MDRCIPAMIQSNASYVHAIDTNGHCNNIYSEENCVGQFIRLHPSLWYQSVLSMAAHRWDDDALVANEKMIVGSIGPCLGKCDPQNWAGMMRDVPTSVTLYYAVDYTGEKRIL